MGAVGLLFRSELRRRWRSWLAVVALVGVAGGLVLAAGAAGRRTASAFPRFIAEHGVDAAVYAYRPLPELAKRPEGSSVTEVIEVGNGQPTCRCTHPINPTDLSVGVLLPEGRPIWQLVSGHLPDPWAPDQVMASFTLQQDDGVQLGSVVMVPFYARSQFSAVANATGALPRPTGPTVALKVVGIEATEGEFPSGSAPSYDLYATPAFLRTVVPLTAVAYTYLVRLRQGTAGLPRFIADLHALSAGGAEGYQADSELVASVEGSIHPQATGWWILAALAALVGLAVVSQALVRQSISEREDYPTMAALGVDRRQLVTLGMARNLTVGLVGAMGAVAVAVALSPIAPLGEARTAEVSTGVAFDTLVLPLGALVTVAVVLALGLWPAARAARSLRPDDQAVAPRPSALVAYLVTVGAPPSAVIGVRNSLQRGSGAASVPVGTAVTGMVLAVIALCGTGVFGGSLSHLTATPRLYGEAFQLNFTDATPEANPGLLRILEHDRAVTGITKGIVMEISINKLSLPAVATTALRGGPIFSIVSGRFPSRDGQIALGGTTMHRLGAHLGSLVRVTVAAPSFARRTVPFQVVSQVSFPVLGGAVSLGTGAAFTTAAYEDAVCPPSPKQAACWQAALDETDGGGLLVPVVPGAEGRAAIKHYLGTYQSIVALPITPTSLINFGEAVDFPLIFGAMLALFGAATLVHLLVVSVSRRRREIGLLKALGFVRGQVASVVAWQATTLALVATVIGVPLGIVAGQWVWRAFAANLGVVPVAVVPVWLVVGLAAGVVAGANILAIAPALAAARTNPVQLLRTA